MNALISLLVAATVLACVPMLSTVREEQSGSILDATSGRPIAGATVVIESWQIPAPPLDSDRELLHSYETGTDGAGHWHVPAERDLKIGVLAADGLPLFIDSFCVAAVGYDFFRIDPWHEEREHRATERFDIDWAKAPAVIRMTPRPLPPIPSPEPRSSSSRCGIPLRAPVQNRGQRD